jgi:hypothetical protein
VDETFQAVYHDAILNAIRVSPHGARLAKIELPDAYYKAAGEQALRRIVAAGVRLGAILNRLDRK